MCFVVRISLTLCRQTMAFGRSDYILLSLYGPFLDNLLAHETANAHQSILNFLSTKEFNCK